MTPINGNVISKTNYEGVGDCKEGPNTYTNSYAINVIDDNVCTTTFEEEAEYANLDIYNWLKVYS